jgi:hypothetical protein
MLAVQYRTIQQCNLWRENYKMKATQNFKMFN